MLGLYAVCILFGCRRCARAAEGSPQVTEAAFKRLELEVGQLVRRNAELEEARRGQGDEAQRLQTQLEQRSRQLDSVEQKLDIVMRGLANPETAPSLWKALKRARSQPWTGYSGSFELCRCLEPQGSSCQTSPYYALK